ncbi:hypothetical protein H2200_000488 [Cladophialophora chaetospira]|uniref:Uncharacterized protein n=1 Tax=Cladophialophora chaetospira TaxID=386627 RepID=A0AA38XPJ4_9EURO|nr:hypothetical protein H2200_000488 [Cladophialophora chaetospira]
MEEAQVAIPKPDQASFRIPRKPVAVGYQPVETGPDPKDQESDKTKVNTTGKMPWFRRWFTALKRFRRWFAALPDRPWLPEVTSLVLACLAFTAIVVTLAVHQGRPLPRWPHLVSIDSLIAIFSAIFKAALITPVAEGIGQLKWDWFQRDRNLIDLNRLDSASRGPWGSCCLLFTNYKHYLAFLGALVTIVALAIDPFSQQVIKYTFCRQPVSNLGASVTVANNYTQAVGPLDLQMASAAYVGILNPAANASAAISFTCNTGNCTFSNGQNTNKATHESLAMCGECKDISKSFNKKHLDESGAEYGGYPINYYSLPNPREAITPYHGDNDSAPTIMDVMESAINGADGDFRHVYVDNLAVVSCVPADDAESIVWFDAIMFTDCSCPDPSNSSSEPITNCKCEPFAARCDIFPCIKTYWAEATNFVLNEIELSRRRINIGGTFTEKLLRYGEWLTCSNSTKPTSDHIVPVWSTRPDGNGGFTGAYTYVQQECTWSYSEEAAAVLGAFLTWNGNLGGSTQLPWLEKVYNSGNATIETLQTQVDGFANTLTGVVRQYGDASESIRPVGTTWRGDLYNGAVGMAKPPGSFVTALHHFPGSDDMEDEEQTGHPLEVYTIGIDISWC